MKCFWAVVILVLIAMPVLAGPPVEGIYYSYDCPGGSFSPGRFGESWAGPGTYGQIGNAINAQSWNGEVMGGEWRLWCASIQAPPVLVSDTRDANDTGEVTYETSYSGGHFWLGAVGPWGDEDYSGGLDFVKVTATYGYVFGCLSGIWLDVVSFGQIDGYSGCMEYEIYNAAFVGDSDQSPKPATFPDFLDEYCSTGVWSRGSWGTVTEIALRIRGECDVVTGVVPEPLTWGLIKSLYRE